jgi:hypothetical protein
MNRIRTPTRGNQSLIAFDVNSGPLSDLMCSGTPFDVKSPVSVCITSSDLILLAALMAIHSLVYSSITVSSLTARPSSVLQETKS